MIDMSLRGGEADVQLGNATQNGLPCSLRSLAMTVAAIVFITALSGCGLKRNLSLPEDEKHPPQEQAQPAATPDTAH